MLEEYFLPPDMDNLGINKDLVHDQLMELRSFIAIMSLPTDQLMAEFAAAPPAPHPSPLNKHNIVYVLSHRRRDRAAKAFAKKVRGPLGIQSAAKSG